MTIDDFHIQIVLPKEYLIRISKRSKYLYQAFQIRKRNGHKRQIESPNRELKGIQAWILENILEKYDLNDSVHGFRKHHSIKTNATPHIGKKYILNLDIKDFFPSINWQMVYEVFRMKCDEDLSQLLTGLCAFDNHLPQGGVTSPAIANIVFNSTDKKIEEVCEKYHVVYTRYADDLSFSSNSKERINTVKSEVIECIEKSGFRINERKTKILSGKGPTIITGLRIVDKKYLSIGNEKKRLLRAEIYNYYKKGAVDNKNRIVGMLSYLKSIEPEKYKYFMEYINKIKR